MLRGTALPVSFRPPGHAVTESGHLLMVGKVLGRAAFSHVTFKEASVGLGQVDEDESVQRVAEMRVYVESQ
jgi:hypothetical protein